VIAVSGDYAVAKRCSSADFQGERHSSASRVDGIIAWAWEIGDVKKTSQSRSTSAPGDAM